MSRSVPGSKHDADLERLSGRFLRILPGAQKACVGPGRDMQGPTKEILRRRGGGGGTKQHHMAGTPPNLCLELKQQENLGGLLCLFQVPGQAGWREKDDLGDRMLELSVGGSFLSGAAQAQLTGNDNLG